MDIEPIRTDAAYHAALKKNRISDACGGQYSGGCGNWTSWRRLSKRMSAFTSLSDTPADPGKPRRQRIEKLGKPVLFAPSGIFRDVVG
jgi:hypothetical protein